MTFALAPHVSVTETDNCMVLLDERAGHYWQLNGTGAAVVRLLLEGGTVEEAITALCASHPLASQRVAADVDALLRSLRAAKVVAS
ncbi:MAG: lasso peptide biosynthesis PqqD family chaperone [Egibacteraceae bacterium]